MLFYNWKPNYTENQFLFFTNTYRIVLYGVKICLKTVGGTENPSTVADIFIHTDLSLKPLVLASILYKQLTSMIKWYITKIIHFTIFIQCNTQQEKKISCKPFFE